MIYKFEMTYNSYYILETIFAKDIMDYKQRYYKFDLPASLYWGRRHVMVFSGFFHPWRKDGLQPNVTNARQFVEHREEEYKSSIDIDRKFYIKYNIHYEEKEVIECKDVFDFFNKIDYDYKLKKYNNKEIIRHWDVKTSRYKPIKINKNVSINTTS